METKLKEAYVKTADYCYQGTIEENGVASFLGIPYAKPPLGSRRFEAPQPLDPVENHPLRVATSPGPISFQDSETAPLWNHQEQVMSEDCLYLNIFTPAKEATDKLPVLFWIHQGASLYGAGSDQLLHGKNLAKKGIIVVTFNYRLGVLGFLAHPELINQTESETSGNYGVLDILAALDWVKERIADFGGNPNHIIMGGQSAGAGATAYLLTSPELKVSLKGAIMLSTAPMSYPGIPYSLAYYEKSGQAYMEQFGLTTYQQLKTAPVSTWLNKSPAIPGHFSFARDNLLFKEELKGCFEKGHYQKVPILMGMTKDEFSRGVTYGKQWSKKQCYQQVQSILGEKTEAFFKKGFLRDSKDLAKEFKSIFGGEWALAEMIHSANWLKQYQEDVYLYRFDQAPPREQADFYGAKHCDDLFYVFGTFDTADFAWRKEDYQLGETMQDYFVSFIKTGNPNDSSKNQWPAWQGQQLMYFGGQETPCRSCELEQAPRLQHLINARYFK